MSRCGLIGSRRFKENRRDVSGVLGGYEMVQAESITHHDERMEGFEVRELKGGLRSNSELGRPSAFDAPCASRVIDNAQSVIVKLHLIIASCRHI